MIIVENIFDNFKSTMFGLEKGLQVINIATPVAQLSCCQNEDDIEAVLNRSDLKPFDQIPVKRQETIIGLLKKRECPEEPKGTAEKHMQSLGEKTLVSADMPLLTFIQDEDSLDRIVIEGTKIYGLVTRSDLLKLPVFLLGFALVTHVETLMLHMIRETGIDKDIWLSWIHPSHKDEIEDKFEELSKERSEPTDMLELSYFSDKSTILQRLVAIEKYAPYLPDKSFISQLPEIKELRNTIAHRKILDTEDFLQKLIDRLQLTRKWIEQIK